MKSVWPSQQEIRQRVKNLKSSSERKYLTQNEVDRLIKAARDVGRHGHRDSLLILLAYRHGLRVSELLNLRWSDIDYSAPSIYIRRIKNGISGHHPLTGEEVRSLKKLSRIYRNTEVLFINENRVQLSTSSFQEIIARAGIIAGFDFKCHPHQLRHSCGYYLANKGMPVLAIKSYLGHKDIKNTAIYCEIAANQFQGLWN